MVIRKIHDLRKVDLMPCNTHILSIFSEQTVDGQTLKSEFLVPCEFKLKNNLGLISYKEQNEDNEVFSSIRLCRMGTIVITRESKNQVSRLTFEENTRHECIYFTDFGNINLGVFTHEINRTFDEKFCNIELRYDLDSNRAHLSENKIIITVKENNDV